MAAPLLADALVSYLSVYHLSVEGMASMNGVRFYSHHDLRSEQLPIPQCKPDEVRLKVAFCGICGSVGLASSCQKSV